MIRAFRSTPVCVFVCVLLICVFTFKLSKTVVTLLNSKASVAMKFLVDVEESEQEEKKDAEKKKSVDYYLNYEKNTARIFPKGLKKLVYSNRSSYPTAYFQAIPAPPPDCNS